jgi:DNA gyrase subunit A
MTIRFDEKQARSMGRASRGVRGIKLRQGDAVVGMVIVEEKAALFTICENGYGKRTGLENYRSQSRGGVGLKNIKTSTRNGKVVALKAVQNTDDLMMITAHGMIIRTGLDQIRSIGRNTQGVRLIKLKPGDKLVAAAKIISEEADNPKINNAPKQSSAKNDDQEQNSNNNKNNKTKSKAKKKRPK